MSEFTTQSLKDAKETNVEVQDAVPQSTVETPISTPEIVDTPVSETTEKSAFFDKFKADKKEEPIPNAEIPKDIQERLAVLEARDKRLKEIEENPHVKLLSGEKDLRDLNITDWLKKSVGDDMSKYSNEDLFRQKLQAKYPGVGKDDLELLVMEEMDEFTKLSDARQKAERSALVSQLSKEPEPNELIKSLKDIQETQKSHQNPQQMIEEAFDNTFNQVHSYMSENAAQLEGQTYMGHTYSKEDCQAIVNSWQEDVRNFNQEKQLFNYAKIIAYEKNIEAAEKRGYERGIKERANPSQNTISNPVINTKDTQGGIKNATRDDFRNAKNINS